MLGLSGDETILLVLLVILIIVSLGLLFVLLMRQRYSPHAFHHRALLIYLKRLRDLFLPKKETEHEPLFRELVDVDELQTSPQRRDTDRNTESREKEVDFEEVASEEKSVEEKELREERESKEKAEEMLVRREKEIKKPPKKLFSLGKQKKGKDDTIMRTLKKAYK